MVLPRRNFRIVITWVILIAFAQVIIYTLLFGELESAPRKGLSDKLKITKLDSAKVVLYPIDGRNLEIVQDSSLERSKLKTIDISVDSADVVTRNKIFLSRKLEKFKLLQETSPKFSSTVASHSINTSETNPGENKIKISKLSNDASVKFVPKARRPTGPDDIFISVKTTRQYHATRLEEIMKTWWTLSKRETYLFTDSEDPVLSQRFDGHLINTKCASGHQRSALCCKMQSELNFFLKKRKKRWFCHFDDDNYVVFPALIKLLQQFNHSEPVYMGKTSIANIMQARDKEKGNQQVKFWFATGGAGFCLSQTLVSLMAPYVSDQGFIKMCQRAGIPDDCTVGFISEHLLGVKLTVIDRFHSHLEWLENIPEHEFRHQVSFSHGYLGSRYNRIKIQGPFSIQDDPSRFKSLHCNLYPQTPWCT